MTDWWSRRGATRSSCSLGVSLVLLLFVPLRGRGGDAQGGNGHLDSACGAGVGMHRVVMAA